MATVSAFNGICFNKALCSELHKIVTPPYDVISPQMRQKFEGCHVNNMVNLVLPLDEPNDKTGQSRYENGANAYFKWLKQGVLQKAQTPCLYCLKTTFLDQDGSEVTRSGVMAAVKLEPFDRGIIRPHERTFSAVKSDRLKLMTASGSQFSPVFGVYTDNEDRIMQAIVSSEKKQHICTFMDHAGLRQEFSAIDDPDIISRIQGIFSEKDIIIADGHHRYETALAYRDKMRSVYKDAGPDAAFNNVLMYLCNSAQKGLSILPTHRLFRSWPIAGQEKTKAALAPFFDISVFHKDKTTPEQLHKEVVLSGEKGFSVGVSQKDSNEYLLLKLKSLPDNIYELQNIPEALRSLDVVLLTELIFKKIVGMDENDLDDHDNIFYEHSGPGALKKVAEGEAEICFIMNPTTLEELESVTAKGLVLPRKSTYFYPKAPTGLVLHDLMPEA